ncbi:hypothetical protein ACKU27_20695 [Sphingobium yanoikuyae]|uniref:hypothetical protein n=1 Tax=Sphingobium yanoikuyae TaxID=13690 RepID=UPI003B8F710B
MIARSLLFFRSPVANPPCFVIPVFSQPGTNQVCVQDLNAAGVIEGFRPFHSDDFYPVHILAPKHYSTEGQQGLLAFWLSQDEIAVGTHTELRVLLKDVDQQLLPPFAAVEISMLLGDSKKMDDAAERASKLIKSEKGRSTYKQRVAGRYRILTEMRKNAVQPEIKEDSLNDILALLQTPLDPEVWIREWSFAMDRFKNDDALISIAEWRLMHRLPENMESRIVSHILSARHTRSHAIAYNWLKDRNSDWPGYATIWISLSRRAQDHFADLDNLGYNYLRNYFLDIRLGNLHSWATIWSRLWKGKYDEDALTALAAKIHDVMTPPNDSIVEHVLMPLSKRPKPPQWVVDAILQWLHIPRATRIWVDNFMRFGDFLERDTHNELAYNWLHNLGYGMNLWREVWNKTRQSRSVQAQIELAIRWLYRARKDLQSWPYVFREVIDLSHDRPSNDLIRSARLWVGFYEHKKRDNVIEDIADLTISDQETFELFPK